MKLEADWSRYVCDRLKKAGWFVQRIESGSTGRGIPDMFVVTDTGRPVWIENKILPAIPENKLAQLKVGETVKLKLPYRPGQIAWHTQVYKAVPVITLTGVINMDSCLITKFNESLSLRSGMATVTMESRNDEYDTLVCNKKIVDRGIKLALDWLYVGKGE